MMVLRESRWSRDCRYTSKFNIYIIIAFVPSSVLDTTLCHRQICRELKFPPFWERHYLQYPRLNSGATRQVAPIVFHDLRFTEPKSVSTARRWKTTRFTFAPNKYVYCLPEGARTRYNRLRNDPVVQLLRFTTQIRAKASMYLDRNRRMYQCTSACVNLYTTDARGISDIFFPLYLSLFLLCYFPVSRSFFRIRQVSIFASRIALRHTLLMWYFTVFAQYICTYVSQFFMRIFFSNNTTIDYQSVAIYLQLII